jgi:hypothetical protein
MLHICGLGLEVLHHGTSARRRRIALYFGALVDPLRQAVVFNG